MSQAESPAPPSDAKEKRPGIVKRSGKWLWSNHEPISHFIQVLAIIAAGIWAFYTFVYTEKIKPSNEPPTLATTATLEKVGRKEIESDGKKISLLAVKATVTANNTSKAEVTVMAAYFNVRGLKIKLYDQRDDQAYHDYVASTLTSSLKDNQDTNVSRHDELHDSTIVHSNNLLQNWTMDPGDQYARSTIFYIPEDNYDLLHITFDIYLARDPRYTEVIDKQWKCDQEGGLSVKFFVKRTDQDCKADDPTANCDSFNPFHNEYHKNLKSKYNLTHYDSSAELSLWGEPKSQ